MEEALQGERAGEPQLAMSDSSCLVVSVHRECSAREARPAARGGCRGTFGNDEACNDHEVSNPSVSVASRYRHRGRRSDQAPTEELTKGHGLERHIPGTGAE
jgi:hypothetical protein